MLKVHSSGIVPSMPRGPRSARRKQRCWTFHVSGITREVTESELLTSVRERYTTVKRLAVSPTTDVSPREVDDTGKTTSVLVEVQFTGPQPSEGPGALLCDLLCGTAVNARPVELPRGRKKRARSGPGSEASDSDDESSKKPLMHVGSMEQLDDEDDEDSPGGRCVAARNSASGTGSSPVAACKREGGSNVRGVAGRNSGGTIAPSSDVSLRTGIALFASKNAPPAPITQAPDEAKALLMRQQLMQHQQQVQQHKQFLQQQQQQHQQQQEQQQQQQQPSQHHAQQQQEQRQQQQQESQHQLQNPSAQSSHVSRNNQWDEVVGQVDVPSSRPGLSAAHSLDMGSVDLTSPLAAQAIKGEFKSDFEPLLNSNGSGGGASWGSNNSAGSAAGMLDSMPPSRQAGTLRGWSFDTSAISETDYTPSGMVMDLCDVDTLFGPEPTSGLNPPKQGTGNSADAGAGRSEGSRWSLSNSDKVIVEPLPKDCDFEGTATPSDGGTSVSRFVGTGAQHTCHLMFTGLDRTGLDLRSLSVSAHFGVDSVHKVGKVAGPIQVGGNGRMYAAVTYPSMREIWPELHSTMNIRVVEVDVVVELRSESGEFQFVGPQLKVTYRRAPALTGDDSGDMGGGRIVSQNTSNRSGGANISADEPNVTYSCVDYSCGDWFADMCHSVFRTGATAHQPLQDDMMGVDS